MNATIAAIILLFKTFAKQVKRSETDTACLSAMI